LSEFEKNIKKWLSIDKENKEEKDNFYYENLLDDVVKLAKERWANNKNVKNKEFDLLITMSGFSPETSIISSKVINPKQVLVISSKKTSEGINIIGEHVVPMIGYSNFHHLTCDPTDPLKIYKLIKNKVSEITNEEKLKAIVDITGGKKIMSAAAGLVAWQLDMPICYIESKNYDPIRRRPIPGGEDLLYLPNPITLYGHEEITRGKVLFNKGQFSEAHDRFLELSERLEEPKYAKFLKDLSKLYSKWCDVDIEELMESIINVKEHLNDNFVILQGFYENDMKKVTKQIDFLESLQKNDIKTKLLNFYLLGLFYKNNLKRYDFSCLFFYRAMEGCFAYRLKNKYNIVINKPVYSNLKINKDELEKRYVDSLAEIGWDNKVLSLPDYPLGYANMAALLISLGDKMFDAKYKFNLKTIVSMGSLRNKSILAHGTTPLKLKDANRLEKFAERFLHAFYETMDGGLDDSVSFKENIEDLKFITLEI